MIIIIIITASNYVIDSLKAVYIAFFGPLLQVNLWNDPLVEEICTSVVLLQSLWTSQGFQR